MQITLPFIIGVLVCVALSMLTFFAGSDQASVLADVSIIWLTVPLLFIALLVLVVLGGLLYGVITLIRVLPPAARKAQVFVANLHITVRKLGDSLVAPVIKVQSFTAKIRAMKRSLGL